MAASNKYDAPGAEGAAREHLAILQQLTSLLCDATTVDEIGAIVRDVLVPAIGATCGRLVVDRRVVVETGTHVRELAAVESVPSARPLAAWWSASGSVLVGRFGVASGCLALGFADELRSQGRPSDARRALVEDVVRQVALAVDRVRMRERLDDEVAARERLLSTLGHELRNPLSPIMTVTQLMRLKAPGQLAKERETIERAAAQIMRIADELHELAHASNTPPLHRARMDLGSIVTAAIERTRPLMHDSAQRMRVCVDSGLIVDADVPRLAHAISNILHNATKFTPRGGHIEIVGTRDDDRVVLAIADNGLGLAAERIPSLFEPFAEHRETGGLGVGLAVARWLVEVHGGTLEAASDGAGRGSTFTMRLPRAAS